MRIALCAGHYPEKAGARNAKHNISENKVATPIIEILAKLIEKHGHSVTIISGRLGHKVREINKGNYDLAIDLHFNADAELEDTDNLKGYGCMTMYYPTSSKRKEQAGKLNAAMAGALDTKDRGPRPALYWGGDNPGTKADYFTDKTNCPAFIPEPGYIDNNAFAEKYLLTNEGHRKVAEAVLQGIKAFNE